MDLYLANVREKILRFRSHPSIAVWCARNEGFPPPVIDAGIQKLMTELERNRLYQPSSTSGRGVNSGGPYFWRAPREYYNFGEPFKTEIGSVSIPTLESIQAMMPAKDWNVINDDWAEHDLAGGAQGGDWYPRRWPHATAPITQPGRLRAQGPAGQLRSVPGDVRRAARRSCFIRRRACITWMSNPAQPSFVWQLYSWDLEPNSALFATRNACEPIHVQMNQNNWHVMVINNTARLFAGRHVAKTVRVRPGRHAELHAHRTLSRPPQRGDGCWGRWPSRTACPRSTSSNWNCGTRRINCCRTISTGAKRSKTTFRR